MKSTVSILNNELDLGLMINSYSEVGFRLNNDFTILGPVILFPRSALSWNVGSINDITEESLSLFTVLEPKIDLLVLGTGDKIEDTSFHKKIFPFLKKHKINLEILPTDQACSTFNFLNSEGRYIAAALIPPTKFTPTDHEVFDTKQRYQNIYEVQD
ncbi:NADH dehydrogenase [ubiquinone] 1 alpha subcomplex assembly factor 3 [Agrilus planipennis]|uniref:NADH dehydrogenase [ubiquinone] 1 alpha subcomplex assembly factor 3 n=1 Tax=Agrilus planipennis TaxID=224129 RepID=A0A1W4W697_AGRPL|nr:NADH dehydrogenase [ubiquinone] 1 alpha subcomplex assembly factor 3 [Agrilus planipennis]